MGLISVASYLTKQGVSFDLEQDGEPGCIFRTFGAGVLVGDELSYSNCRCGACLNCCRIDNFDEERMPSEEYFFYNR